MASYASYYAPINQALQNFNAQINENARRKMAAEHNLAQTQAAATKMMYERTDPRRVLAVQQAADQLAPTPLNIKQNMPQGGENTYAVEQWNAFKPHVGSIVGDPGAEIKPDGSILGSDGNPVILPAYKANQIQNRINAAQMFEFDGESQRRTKMDALAGKISKERENYNKTKDPVLSMKIKGMQSQLDNMTKEYENPQRRMLALQGKMSTIDGYLAKAFTAQNPDQGWIETLKWQSAQSQKEYEAILKQMGKSGNGEGIQLKRYVNLDTGQVIDYPISKFEGAAYKRFNPIVGGVRHDGMFVLQDSSSNQLSGPDALAKAQSFINDIVENEGAILKLENAIAKNGQNDKFLKTMNLDDDTIALMSQDTIDVDAAKEQIARLRRRNDYYVEELQGFQNPQVRAYTKPFLGERGKPGKMQDPAGLTLTNTGSKYKDTGADSVLFDK